MSPGKPPLGLGGRRKLHVASDLAPEYIEAYYSAISAQKSMNNQTVSEIEARSPNDMYLSDDGPLFFTRLLHPAKELVTALKKDMLNASEWNTQFEACNVIRRALRFHVEQFSSERVRQAIEGMLSLSDSLRSSLAKNAILTLADLFTFLSEGLITDA